MAKALSSQELIRRAVNFLTDAGNLLDHEPADAHEHGCWVVRIRSLICHGDKAISKAFRRGGDQIECGRLKQIADSMWEQLSNARRG